MRRGAWLRWLISLVVSAIFLWLAFRAVDPLIVWQTIVGADQSYLIPAIACTTLTFVLRGVRWRLCFAPQARVTFAEAGAAYGVGVAAAQVIPARLGDLVRVYMVGRWSAVSTSTALGTLVVERLSDMFAVVIGLAILLPLFSLPNWIKVADAFAAAVAIGTLGVVYLLAGRTERLIQPSWVASRRFLPTMFGWFVEILDGFSAVKDPRRGLLILLASFAVWVAQTSTYTLSFWAVHIPLGWKEGALTTMVLALTAIIPTGPGFAGSFEIVAQNLLAIFSVDKALATGYLEYTRIPLLVAVSIYAIIGVGAVRLSRPRCKVDVPQLQRDGTYD